MKFSVIPVVVLLFTVCAPSVAFGQGGVHLEEPEPFAAGDLSAISGDENFLIVWRDGPTIFARELDEGGAPAGVPAVVDMLAQLPANGLEVDSVGGQEFVVAWDDPYRKYDQVGRDHEVFAQRFEGTTPIGEVLAFQPKEDSTTRLTGLAAREDGHFVVSWDLIPYFGYPGARTEAVSPTDQILTLNFFNQTLAPVETNDGFGVIARTNVFNPIEYVELASDGTSGDTVADTDITGLFQGSVASEPGRNFLVVWRDSSTGEGMARLRDEAFSPLTDAFELGGSSTPQAFPAVGGGHLIAWLEVLEPPDRAYMLRYLRPDGVLEPAVELLNSANSPRDLDLSVDRYGALLATWRESDDSVWTRRGRVERGFEVDSFETDQAALVVMPGPIPSGAVFDSIVSGLDMLGGERDVQLEMLGGSTGQGSLEVSGGDLTFSQTGDVTALASVTWDQADGDAGLDNDGLRALDLTSGGSRDSFLLEIANITAGGAFRLEVGDGASSSEIQLDFPSGATDESFVIPFEDFVGAADFTAVGFVRLDIDGAALPAFDLSIEKIATAARVEATQEVVDLNGGDVEPGDVLEYRVSLENPADSRAASATLVVYRDRAPKGTELLCLGADGPTVSQGSVAECDSGIGGFEADLGTVTDGGVATLTFRVSVLETADDELCTHGLVDAAALTAVLTDEMSTSVPMDETCIAVVAPAQLEIDPSIELIDDADASGEISAGDRVRVTALLSHVGGDRNADGLVFRSAPDADLIAGTVVSTQGSVLVGNGNGDTAVEIDLGTLLPAASATVTYEIELRPLDNLVDGVLIPSDVTGTGLFVRDVAEIDGVFFPVLFDISMRDLLIDDADLSGFPSAGDTLRYEVEFSNAGGRRAGASTFSDSGFDVGELLPGTVTATEGVITSGNDPGDSRVDIKFQGLEPLGQQTVSITYDVMIPETLPPGEDEVLGRSGVNSDFLNGFWSGNSDDPDTSIVNDPTWTPIVLAPGAEATLVDEMDFDPAADGLIETGDRIRYTLEITSTGSGSLHRVASTTAMAPSLRPLCASIETDGIDATVSCDASVGGEVIVELRKIVEGQDAQITWVAEAINPGLGLICGQASIAGLGFMLDSDDPDLGGATDPTCRGGLPSGVFIFYDGFESGDVSLWSGSLP